MSSIVSVRRTPNLTPPVLGSMVLASPGTWLAPPTGCRVERDGTTVTFCIERITWHDQP